MMRLRMSLPRLSVPKGWAHDGPWSRRSGCGANGLCGEIVGPITARTAKAATRASPASAVLLLLNCRYRLCRSIDPEPRVQAEVQDVDDQIDDDHDHGKDQDAALDRWIVSGQEGVD